MRKNSILERLSEAEREIVQRHTQNVPVRLGPLAQDLGVAVFASTLPPSISGQISRVRKGDGTVRYEIKINRHESKKRQRFTLAHELAHFLLHRDRMDDEVYDDVLYRSKLSNHMEYEANQLAAEITMPIEHIQKVLEEIDDEDDELTAKLSDQFGVSEAAISVRLGL